MVAGPSPDQVDRAWLFQQAREWAPLLADYTEVDLEALVDELAGLPLTDLSLQVPLPRLLPPPLERLRRVVADRDGDAAVAAAAAAVSHIDTPSLRAQLARAILALHDEGHRIDCDVTAYAMLDLAEETPSTLLLAALLTTMAVTTGSVPTPSGLLLAGR